MIRRTATVSLSLLVLLLGTTTRADRAKTMVNANIAKTLTREKIEVKDFVNEMTLREALQLLMEKFRAAGKELPIIVDTQAFRMENPEAQSIYDTPVKLMPFPVTMVAATALELMLNRVDPPNATYLIRDGMVVITTKREASPPQLLRRSVVAFFHDTPFGEAVEELSAITGASIVVDNRLGDKLKAPVTASLRNDVTLEAALRMLADMVDVKTVFLTGGIYITEPANADNMQNEIAPKQRKK